MRQHVAWLGALQSRVCTVHKIGRIQEVAVPHRQTQPQMALVHAAQQVKEQLAMENGMIVARRPTDPISGIKLGAGDAALSMILAYGYVSLAARKVRTAQVLLKEHSVRYAHRRTRLRGPRTRSGSIEPGHGRGECHLS